MQWYDTTDQLPPDGEDVLVSDGEQISIARYTRTPEWKGWYEPSTIDVGCEGEGLSIDVKYWMPLGPFHWMLSVRSGNDASINITGNIYER